MEIIKELLSEIQQSQSKGNELLIDHYLVGYLFGTGQIKSIEEVRSLIKDLSEIKQDMDDSKISAFSRDYYINQILMRSGAHSQEFSSCVQKEKKQSDHQVIHEDNKKNTPQKQEDKQQIGQIPTTDQNQQQLDEIKEKNKQQIKQSQKQYNAHIQKAIQNSKQHNQKQN
ncbi:unnamed protein product [Paramecium octaurelia]|uniref:Uncharacterized protein n=1 Tax=Paramecium octaurelia TaxID=43137 RepID=A0A8S1U534_PAROT|nr:unnamed protein product [Paramecium octaurelia]